MGTADQRQERIKQRISDLRDEVRADLDAARSEMPPEQYENYHRHTVDSAIREIKELLTAL